MSTQIIRDLDETIYHSQKNLSEPHFSASIAKMIMDKSEYHAWYYHPKLGGHSKGQTDSMKKGTIIHDHLLGGGPEIVVFDVDSWATKEGKAKKEERDLAESEGNIVLKKKEWDEYQDIFEKIDSQIVKIIPDFFADSRETELTIYWETESGVKVQSRIDHFNNGITTDVKTITNASPEYLERQIYNMGYDIQESCYTDAIEKAFTELSGRSKFQFLFIETEEPYCVSLIETDSAYKEVGNMRFYQASERWRVALETNNWNGYGNKFVYAPAYAMKNIME